MDEVNNLKNNKTIPSVSTSVKKELEDFKTEQPEDQLVSIIKTEDNLKTENVSFLYLKRNKVYQLLNFNISLLYKKKKMLQLLEIIFYVSRCLMINMHFMYS